MLMGDVRHAGGLSAPAARLDGPEPAWEAEPIQRARMTL
jgi:hypothetical protein